MPNIVIPQQVRSFAVDVFERVSSTFAEAVLAGMTQSGLTVLAGHGTGAAWVVILNTAGYTALYAGVKSLAGGMNPKSKGAALVSIPAVKIAKVSGADVGP